MADKNSIEVLSIVDHDTVETIEKIKNIKERKNIKFVPGVEISAYDYRTNKKVHLLAYGYKDAKNIKKLCEKNLINRNENSEKKLQIIREHGFMIDRDVKRSVNLKETLYKQHIMRAMTDSEFESRDYQNLYKALFKNGGIAHFDFEYVDIFDALDAVLEDEAVPVLAHPREFDSYYLVEELAQKGLRGIEVYHSSHKESDIEKSKELAEKYDLFITGGSDDHGLYGKNYELGNVNLDRKILEELNLDTLI